MLILPYLGNKQTNHSGIKPNSLEAWPRLLLSVSTSYHFGCLSPLQTLGPVMDPMKNAYLLVTLIPTL